MFNNWWKKRVLAKELLVMNKIKTSWLFSPIPIVLSVFSINLRSNKCQPHTQCNHRLPKAFCKFLCRRPAYWVDFFTCLKSQIKFPSGKINTYSRFFIKNVIKTYHFTSSFPCPANNPKVRSLSNYSAESSTASVISQRFAQIIPSNAHTMCFRVSAAVEAIIQLQTSYLSQKRPRKDTQGRPRRLTPDQFFKICPPRRGRAAIQRADCN